MAREDREREEEYRNSSQSRPKNSGLGIAIVFIVFALLFIIGPIAAPKGTLGTISQTILVSFGVALLLIGMITMIITRLYIKTSADQAFVRTGMGGPKVIMDGGAIVIPVVHNMVPVSLQTMRLDVARLGTDALLTGDKLRADVIAEFYIRVKKDEGEIMNAAMTMGARTMSVAATKDLVFQKLENALRAIGFTKTLEDLNKDREGFATAVKEMVEKDLKPNGLTLETVTISKLDQTDPKDLKPDNVFDAQGMRTIAEITQNQRVLTNALKTDADKKVEQQNVEKEQYLLSQKLLLAESTANNDANIRIIQSTKQQEAATVAADQGRLAGIAEVKKTEGIQTAEIEKDKNLEVARTGKEQAIQIAEIGKEKAKELAVRDKEISIAGAETKRADAETLQQAAEKLKEQEKQGVLTVTVVQTAEREKQKMVITEQASIQKERLRREMEADVSAYTIVKQADGELTAADKKAEAKIKTATAEKTAQVLKAEGDQAVQIVPVNVDKEKVTVEGARVDVQRKDLANKSEFDKISQVLTIQLALIEMLKAIGTKQAEAMGEALSNADLQIWGSTEMLDKINGAFYNGQASAKLVEGLVDNLPAGVKETAMSLIGMLTDLGKAGTAKLAGATKEEEAK